MTDVVVDLEMDLGGKGRVSQQSSGLLDQTHEGRRVLDSLPSSFWVCFEQSLANGVLRWVGRPVSHLDDASRGQQGGAAGREEISYVDDLVP